jgi:O-acetyl-ADP-ribose deacetylase (regulator of RNase III)
MGALCGKPAPEETVVTRASVSFKLTFNNVTFENISGDIADQVVDAIVNAANNQLAHNNGLANTLIVRGGVIIQDESNKLMEDTEGILEVGTAVVTTAGRLSAKFIIHVVSPIWNGGDNGEEERLALAVVNALTKADEVGVTSLAVPSISSGSFGFPAERCAEIMVRNTLEYLERNSDSNINLIRFVNMDAQTVRIFRNELERVLRKNAPVEEIDVVELRKTEEIIEVEPNGDIVIEEVVVEEVVVEEVVREDVVVEEVYREDVVVEEVVVEEVIREDVIVEEVVREEVFVEDVVVEERVEEVVEIDQYGQVEEVAVVEEVVVREVVEEVEEVEVREFVDEDGNVEEEVVLERSPVDIVVETTEEVVEQYE